MSMIAAQLFTVREFTKTPEAIENTLKKVREIGYEAVQVSAFGPIDAKRLKGIVDEEGLAICATHTSYDRMKNDLDGVIAEHKLWDCRSVGIGIMPNEFRGSKEGYQAFAKEATAIARKLKDAGLQLIYHNHNFEFAHFDGKAGMDILFEESDSDAFHFEIDTYWVQAGGGDPAAWIRKTQGRLEVVHFKDMTANQERKPMMAEVGEGNLNWPAVVQACRDIGVEWIAVEQDFCQRDPFESLAISYKNLRAMGLQ